MNIILAPVLSPLSQTALIIFSISENKQLVAAIFEIGYLGPGSFTKTPELPDGYLLVPSKLAAVRHKEMVRVYGFIEQADAKGNKHNRLYMLSPVQKPVDIVESPQGRLAGFSDGNTQGCLYFVDTSQTIREQSLALVGHQPEKVNENVKLYAGTDLAACLGDDNARYVAYQMASGALQVFDAKARKPLPDIDSTIDPKKKTPLALAQYRKEGKSHLNLYYVNDRDGVLMRFQRIEQSDWVSRAFKDARKPTDSTTLGACWSSHISQVIVTYKDVDGHVNCMPDRLDEGRS